MSHFIIWVSAFSLQTTQNETLITFPKYNLLEQHSVETSFMRFISFRTKKCVWYGKIAIYRSPWQHPTMYNIVYIISYFAYKYHQDQFQAICFEQRKYVLRGNLNRFQEEQSKGGVEVSGCQVSFSMRSHTTPPGRKLLDTYCPPLLQTPSCSSYVWGKQMWGFASQFLQN